MVERKWLDRLGLTVIGAAKEGHHSWPPWRLSVIQAPVWQTPGLDLRQLERAGPQQPHEGAPDETADGINRTVAVARNAGAAGLTGV